MAQDLGHMMTYCEVKVCLLVVCFFIDLSMWDSFNPNDKSTIENAAPSSPTYFFSNPLQVRVTLKHLLIKYLHVCVCLCVLFLLLVQIHLASSLVCHRELLFAPQQPLMPLESLSSLRSVRPAAAAGIS